jgi:uncharacterized protein
MTAATEDLRVKHRTKRPDIVVRRIEVDLDAPTEKYWYRGEPAITAFAYALSSVFPEGERFFIDSVRAFRDRIDDPALAAEVRAFVGQEAQHGQVHEQYNRRAEAQGFRTSVIAKLSKKRLERLRRVLPPEEQLAITCALEHFTAMMAEQLLGDPRFTEGVEPSHAAVWRWHAAEEAEHKAVAFDVYAKVNGSYARRIRTYLVASVGFSVSTLIMTGFLLHQDGRLFEPKRHLALLRWLFVTPGLARNVLPGWLDYLRPNFHPWDRDDRALLDRWKREWAPAFR